MMVLISIHKWLLLCTTRTKKLLWLWTRTMKLLLCTINTMKLLLLLLRMKPYFRRKRSTIINHLLLLLIE